MGGRRWVRRRPCSSVTPSVGAFRCERVDGHLPDKVDSEVHAGVLSKLGVNPKELLSKLPGGLGDKLGGLLGDH